MDILKRVSIFFLLFLGVLRQFSGDINITVYKNQITDYFVLKQEQERRQRIINAVAFIESSFNEAAYNKDTDARGFLQIRNIMVCEVNQRTGTEFIHDDCWDKEKSIELFTLFQNHFNPTWDLELAARMWHGGCNGHNKISTELYYKKVKKVYENFLN